MGQGIGRQGDVGAFDRPARALEGVVIAQQTSASATSGVNRAQTERWMTELSNWGHLGRDDQGRGW